MSQEGGHASCAAGAAVCGTTIDLGELRLDSAFFCVAHGGPRRHRAL